MSDDVNTPELVVGDTEIELPEPQIGTEGAEEGAPPAEPATDVSEPKKVNKKPWYEERLSDTTAQRNEARAEADRVRKENEELRAKLAAGATGVPEEEIEKIVRSRVEKELPLVKANQEFIKRTTDILEYGKQNFNDFTDSLKKMNEIVGDQWDAYSGTLAEAVSKEEAAKIITHLANDPDEAIKIASLSYPRQIAEFTRMGIKLTESKPENKISNAPKPITAISTAHASPAPKSIEKASTAAEHHKIRMTERKAKGLHTW